MYGLTEKQRGEVIGQFYEKHRENGKSYVVKLFKAMGLPRSSVYRALARIDEGLTAEKRPGSGRPAKK